MSADTPQPCLQLTLYTDGTTDLELPSVVDDETAAGWLEHVAAAVRAGRHRTGLPSTP